MGALWILVALVLLAFNLRGPLTALPPVIDAVQTAFSIGPATAGLLTGIPVLCFGLLTPLASVLIGRVGTRAAILLTLGGVLVGSLMRPAGGLGLALAGTLVLGAAMTVGNIVSLMVIAARFQHRLNAVTGLYTSALNVGTMLTSALTVPLAQALGWRPALAGWAVLAVAALAVWARVPAIVTPPPASAAALVRVPAWRQGRAWVLAVAMAAHLSAYYGLTAWLPAYLMQSDGMDARSAGIASAVFQILALIGAFGVPVLAAGGRWRQPHLLVSVAVLWVLTPLGFLLWPGAWELWALTGGIASGGGFTIIFMLIMNNARDLDENRAISALVQGGGYTLSASAPFAVGALHQASGLWAPGFIALAVAGLVMAASGLVLARLLSRS